MKESMGDGNHTPELLKSVIYLTTKYSLFRMSQVKIVSLLSDVE
jgi:hypothetical protein